MIFEVSDSSTWCGQLELCNLSTRELFTFVLALSPERDVAYNLLQAIGGAGGRKHSAYRAGQAQRARHPTAGVQTTYSIWDQLKNASWDNGELVIAGQSLKYVRMRKHPRVACMLIVLYVGTLPYYLICCYVVHI